MAIWSSSYELVPAQTDAPSTLGTTGRSIRVDIRERWENEHTSYTAKGGSSGGSVSADMIHKAGSAKAYYQSSAPGVRPDGSTALNAADAGRIWIDTSVGRTAKVWSGSSWDSLSFAGSLRVYSNATDYTEVYAGSGYGFVMAYRSGSGGLPLYLNHEGSWVSVGTTSNPSGYTLYVGGTIGASGTVYAGGFSTSGTITAGAISCYSADYQTLIASSGEFTVVKPITVRISFYLVGGHYGQLKAKAGEYSWYAVEGTYRSSGSGAFVTVLNPGRYKIDKDGGTYEVYQIGNFG